MFVKLFYIEYRNGNCTIMEQSSERKARVEGDDFAQSFGTQVRLVREATTEDVENYGGAIYRS